MTTRELATHIYNHVKESIKNKSDSNRDSLSSEHNEISYIVHLMDLHHDSKEHLGSKGFVSISRSLDNRTEFGC